MYIESSAPTMSCSHYSGCGNEFLLVDNRNNTFSQLTAATIRTLCDGVDGFIVINASTAADVRMQYYNCDGNEAAMCGNGARCVLKFLREKCDWKKPFCTLETDAGVVTLKESGSQVVVEMTPPSIIQWHLVLPYQNREWLLHHIDTGVPHVVTFVENIESIDVAQAGQYFRSHRFFTPKGVNVNFVQIRKNEHDIRTFERGVERETAACGTGACAAAIALHYLYNCASPITLCTRSKNRLEVHCMSRGTAIEKLELKGPAQWIKDIIVV